MFGVEASLTAAVFCTIACGVGLLALLVAELRRSGVARAVIKPLTSAAFLAVAVANGALTAGWAVAVGVALGLSWVGDVLLLWRSPRGFLSGLLAFLLAHLAFAVAFVLRGWDPVVAGGALLVLAVVASFVGRWLLPRAPTRMRAPIVVYIAVIVVMVALAFATAAAEPAPAIAVAAVAFLISDVGVAVNRFITPAFHVRAWALPLYYIAQLTFAWSIG